MVRRGVGVVLGIAVLAASAHAAELTDSAARALARAREGERVRLIVVMKPTAERGLSTVRPQEVGAALRAVAEESQAPVLREVSRSMATGAAREARSLPIINGLALEATEAVVRELLTRSDIEYITVDGTRYIPPWSMGDSARDTVSAADWQIANIRADEAWSTFGYRGDGIVIGSFDTGVDITHPALAANWRGGGTSWFDAVKGKLTPYDDAGHGTATTSNACGNDATEGFYGVAPNAKFIAAKAFNKDGAAADSWLLECAAWMLDPDQNPATDDAPDIVNNSWGGGSRDLWFQDAIAAWHAAGLYPVFAAGNAGPGARTIDSPGDYLGVMAVGATRSDNVIAGFSSRGPVMWAGVDHLKPNIAAPGDNVKVAVPTDRYISTADGTSFACPHVAGAAALILQKNGPLTATELNGILESTAQDLGDPGPDYDYGHGLLDVYAALAEGGPGNQAPVLTFLGSGGYVGDGVDPNAGDASTDFTWKVRYADADGDSPVGGVKLHILKAGQAIAGSPFPMTREGAAATPVEEVYALTRRLVKGDYSYRFEATDGTNEAIGIGSEVAAGPTLANTGPVLAWSDEEGYGSDAVRPNTGDRNETRFRFAVKYSDADGDAPTTIVARISRDGEPYVEVTLEPSKPRYIAGAIFRGRKKLPGGTYSYRMVANDGEQWAAGEPTRWQSGPVLRMPPQANWPTDGAFAGDGVSPDTGTAETTVIGFRVKVTDSQGKAPDLVQLQLRRDGSHWGTFDMTKQQAGFDLQGRTYRYRSRLPAGSYSQRVVAKDKDGLAKGSATDWTDGPVITQDGVSGGIASLSAVPTARGADIALTLAGPGAVTCRVLNLAGVPIRTVCRERELGSGVQRLAWDGKAETGLAVPGGTYLVEAVVRGEGGETTRALCPLRLGR